MDLLWNFDVFFLRCSQNFNNFCGEFFESQLLIVIKSKYKVFQIIFCFFVLLCWLKTNEIECFQSFYFLKSFFAKIILLHEKSIALSHVSLFIFIYLTIMYRIILSLKFNIKYGYILYIIFKKIFNKPNALIFLGIAPDNASSATFCL